MNITIVGNKENLKVDPKNPEVIDYKKALNYKQVNMIGVNSIVVRRFDDESIIITQTAGYSRLRGFFVDVY